MPEVNNKRADYEAKLCDTLYKKYSKIVNIGRCAGLGSYSYVYDDVHDITHIIKIYREMEEVNYFFPDPFISLDALCEISAIKTLAQVSNVPEINAVSNIENHFYVSMERCNGKINYTEKSINLNTIYDIVYVLAKAQEKFILHRDIKPQNIMTKNSNGYLIDWGLSTFIYSHSMRRIFTKVQTLWYRSPEHHMFTQEGLPYLNNFTMDMWSIGLVILEMLMGKPYITPMTTPRSALDISTDIGNDIENDFSKMFYNYFETKEITTKKLTSTLNSFTIDENLIDFVKRCLQLNPLTRLDPISALSHPLFFKIEKKDLPSNDPIINIDNVNYLKVDKYKLEKYNAEYFSNRSKLYDEIVKVFDIYVTHHEVSRIITILDFYLSKHEVVREDIPALVLASFSIVFALFDYQQICITLRTLSDMTKLNNESLYKAFYRIVFPNDNEWKICSADDCIVSELILLSEKYIDYRNLILMELNYNIYFKTICMYELLFPVSEVTLMNEFLNLTIKITKSNDFIDLSPNELWHSIMCVLENKFKTNDIIKSLVLKKEKNISLIEKICNLSA